MKKISLLEHFIQEALGVPENIHQTSTNIFGRILRWVNKLDESDFESGEGVQTSFRGDFNISDYRFSTVKIKVGVEKFEQLEEADILSMVVRSESRKTDDFKLEPVKTKTVDIVILIGVPEDFNFEDLTDFFIEKKNYIIESLSHELKHSYDHFKKLFDSPQRRAEYQSAISVGTNIPPVDRFLHDIYYTTANENLVRPSEVASAIINNEISQKNFLNFLKSNETYSNLKRISNFNLENFKNEILKYKRNVDELLKSAGMKPSKMSDEEKINSVLKIVYYMLTDKKIDLFKEMLTHSFFEEMLGFEGEKQKVFEKFIARNTRFTNPEDFFKSYEKYFHFIGDKMMRKISKLYAITEKR